MKAGLQTQIAPPTAGTTQVMSDAKVQKDKNAQDSTGPKEEVDFKNVLFNSNMDTKKTREAKKNGDLSAETQEEFLERLAEQTKQQRVPKNKLDKDDFLKLFVTQLQHQDPLNPDDGAEMAAKLAQFNSLEQLMNVNKALEKMANAESTNRNMMMSSFIGKDIQVNGGRVMLNDSKVTDSKFDLTRGAKNATLQVRDTNGVLIREQELGSLSPGEHKLQWDGLNRKGEKAPDGIYTYSVMALDAEGKDLPINISSNVKVMGIDVGDTTGTLFTDYGRVKLDQVKAIGEQGFYMYQKNKVKDGSDSEKTPEAAAAQAIAKQEDKSLTPKRPAPIQGAVSAQSEVKANPATNNPQSEEQKPKEDSAPKSDGDKVVNAAEEKSKPELAAAS